MPLLLLICNLLTSFCNLPNFVQVLSFADPDGETGGPPPPPLKNHQNIGVFLAKGQFWSRSPEKNHKPTKAAFNVGPSFRWQADDGPLIMAFDHFFPHQLEKTTEKTLSNLFGPPLTKFSGSAHGFSLKSKNFSIKKHRFDSDMD